MATDWLRKLQAHATEAPPEIAFAQLRAGDRLQVATAHTVYDFTVLGSGETGVECELATNRADRPRGRVRLIGCCLGASTTIAPGRVFCGGNLEFTHDGGALTMTTTAIRALQVIARRAAG